MDEISAFGALGVRLGLLLHYTDVVAMAALTERLERLDLTPVRSTALVYVALHEGCDQMALGKALGVNRARTMKLVDELEAQGVIERRAGRDRRSNALFLKPAGAALRARVEQASIEHDQAFFGALTPVEQTELRRLLTRLWRDETAQSLVSSATLQTTT